MTADLADSRTFSARQAAEHCGVDDKTIRAWLRSGKIVGDRMAGAWRIPADQLAPLRRQPAPDAADTPRPSAPDAAPDAAGDRTTRADSALSAPLLEALRQIEEVRRENRDLAGQVGYLQRQVQEQGARLLALDAPARADTPESAHASILTGQASEGPSTPAASRKRPWWRVWG